MGYGPNFTRVAVEPAAKVKGKKTLFINGESSPGVKPPLEIAWVAAANVKRDGMFNGMVLVPRTKKHHFGPYTQGVNGTDWSVEIANQTAPDVGDWIVLSGRLQSKDPSAPPIVWSNTLRVERAEDPKG